MRLDNEQAKHVAETLRIIAIAELASLAIRRGLSGVIGGLWQPHH